MTFAEKEQLIKEFVLNKIAEPVYLEVQQYAVSIKSTDPKGSTILAILWAKVLQHELNYPVKNYTYEKVSKNGSERLLLNTDEVQFTLHLDTGRLQIEGKFVLQWFKTKFEHVLNRYENMIYDDPVTHIYKTRFKKDPLNTKYVTLDGDEKTSVVDTIKDEKIFDIDVWDYEDDLNVQTESVRKGCVRSGPRYIYKLWKSLLYKWFRDGWKVYIVSPFIDSERLCDISDIYGHWKDTAILEGIFTRRMCNGRKTIFDVEEAAFSKYPPNKQTFIQYHIFNKVKLPNQSFHCKFIAAEKDGEAQIMITSANFDESHFEYNNQDTVMYMTCSAEDLKSEYIDPIVNHRRSFDL